MLVVRVDVVTDGVEQVGLAEAGRSVDEQRVVAAARCFGDSQGGREGELVGRTLDERLERVAGVQPRFVEQERLLRRIVRGPARWHVGVGMLPVVERGRVDLGDAHSPVSTSISTWRCPSLASSSAAVTNGRYRVRIRSRT